MAKLTLDLHPIFNRGAQIEQELERVIDEAERKKSPPWKSFPAREAGSSRNGCCASWTERTSSSVTTGWTRTGTITVGFLSTFDSGAGNERGGGASWPARFLCRF